MTTGGWTWRRRYRVRSHLCEGSAALHPGVSPTVREGAGADPEPAGVCAPVPEAWPPAGALRYQSRLLGHVAVPGRGDRGGLPRATATGGNGVDRIPDYGSGRREVGIRSRRGVRRQGPPPAADLPAHRNPAERTGPYHRRGGTGGGRVHQVPAAPVHGSGKQFHPLPAHAPAGTLPCGPGQPLHDELSISDICFRWGFNGSAHFSRAFRKEYGLSPREYRRQQVEERVR